MSLVNRKKNNQGFTLVEALVYFSILLIASVAAVATYLSYSDILRELNARTIITDNAQVVMERVVREVRNAGAVDPFNTIEDIAVGSLGLTSVDSGDVTFTVEGNQLSLSSNGQPAINLTDDNLDVTEFRVHRYIGSETELIRLVMTLSATSSGTTTISETFYSGAVLRRTYD